MRGATSPRLLLELTCAQVLLPTAATDEKALLARLERLEKGTSAAPRQVPQSPQRPPHSAPDDDAERARVPSPAARPAPESPERPQAASPPVRSAPEPPEPARPAPPPARAASAPPAAGSSPTDSLRANWDAIVETVRQESRVAWALLRNANVLSLDDGVLTLRFPREGEMRAFSVSGHDGVLKRVLSNDFGLNATIKGVAGGDAQTGRPAPAAARPPAVRRDPAPVPSESAPPDFAGPEFEGPEFAEPYDEPDDMPPGGSHEDEPSPDDRAVRNAELTGMDLIQRELGGQVIGEFEG
jgi:DNA polymerase-3 subunit gamma/tau